MSKVVGRKTYFWEKLHVAVSSSMFAETPEAIAGVLMSLHAAVGAHQQNPFLEDEQAKADLHSIRSAVATSEKDRADPRGGWVCRAERMGPDAKLILAKAMWDLYQHVNEFNGA